MAVVCVCVCPCLHKILVYPATGVVYSTMKLSAEFSPFWGEGRGDNSGTKKILRQSTARDIFLMRQQNLKKNTRATNIW